LREERNIGMAFNDDKTSQQDQNQGGAQKKSGSKVVTLIATLNPVSQVLW